jgi:hypothetical protein
MKLAFALLALAVLATSGLARSWPKWTSTHVSEIRFRDGVPGEQLRAVSSPSEIEKILEVFRRAEEVRKKDAPNRWQVCIDVIGQRPEAGRWLLNLDTGDCAFLDPFVQPTYRLLGDERQMLKKYFLPKETVANQSLQQTDQKAPVADLERSAK